MKYPTSLPNTKLNPAFCKEGSIEKFSGNTFSYEYANHLGNVLTVISDKKLMKCPIPDTIASEDFTPDPFVYGQWYNRNSWGRGNSSLHISAGKLIVEDSITSDPHARLNYMLPYDLEPNHTYRVKVDITKNHGTDPWYADIFYSATQNGYEGTFVRVDTLYDGSNNFTFKVPGHAWRIRFLHHSVAEDIEYGFDNFSIVDITEGESSYYIADVVAATDYSPFGAPLPERTFTASTNNYRFAFNGKENDDETYGDGNEYDYGFRIYNPRLGKFLSVDPIAKEYPWNSTYAFAENDVIRCIDLDGLEKVIYTITKTKSDGGTVITTVTSKTLDKAGPLGDGAAVVLNRFGKKYYLYGEKSKDLKNFVTHYEGREDKVYPSLEGGAPTGGIGHKLNDPQEQKDYPVGTELSDETIEKWFKTDWAKKEKLVDNNESTKDLVGGQKEAMVDFTFNGLKPSAFKKGNDETFFADYMKGLGGTLKKRIGQMILFRDNEKYNFDYVKDKKSQKTIDEQVK